MIFNEDNRVKIDYRQEDGRFVQILSTFSDGTILQGSGAVIGENDVLTAAHVLYSHTYGEAIKVEVTPSRFNDYKPFGVVYADNYFLTQDWIDQESYNYDYAVVHLSTPIGYYTGELSYGYLNDPATTANIVMKSYGYAGDIEDGEYLISTNGTPDAIQNNILLFQDDMDVMGGQSGSAVLVESNKQDVVIGVVSHHSYFPDQNGIFALTKEAVENIDEWVASDDENIIPLKTTSYHYKDVQKISHLYTALLGREADEDGLKYWTAQLDRDGRFEDIIGGFLDSKELQNGTDYAGDNNSRFIINLYKNILARDPDEDGFKYWLNEINTFSTKSKVVGGFLDSQEYVKSQYVHTYTLWHNWFESFQREIYGSSNSEILKGSTEDDYIDSKEGNDTISGNGGSDYFVFDMSLASIDTITDFDLSNDILDLQNTTNLRLANLSNSDTLVLYEDEDSYIVLNGLVKAQYNEILFA